ncbi:MAG TPA: ABC transporter permease [Spongiibacteraceae bacterium]|nr:ABC transporter permease [Spongiibacteraceae bacterium]
MWRYLVKRLLSGVLTVWFIATATFFAMHAVPGDPLSSERAVSTEIRRNLVAKYGLDQPLAKQYLLYLHNMLHGDFGISFTQQNRRVNDIIREHFPVSALLGVIALIIATSGAIVWGAVSAHCRERWPDTAIMALVICAVSVPSFVIAAIAQWLLLAIERRFGIALLPVAGWGSWRHVILPAWVLGLGTMAYMTRLLRATLLEVAQADYLRTARAKGLSSARIFVRHQLRNALLPVITVLGPTIAAITTGGFVVELIFAIPGLGRYFVEAVQQLDYTVIMGTTVFYGAFLVAMVLIVDIVYGIADPRIRMGR